MNKVIGLVFLFSLVACNKASQLSLPYNELIGTWKLIAYCKPTGTITCTQITVPTDKNVFISFSKNKVFSENYQNTKPIDYSFLGCGGGSYDIEDKNIRIMAWCMSSSNGRLISILSLTSQRLVLNPFGTGEYIFEKQ